MTTYGYEIVQTLIVDVIPHETVKRAMNEINAGLLFLYFLNFENNCRANNVCHVTDVCLPISNEQKYVHSG